MLNDLFWIVPVCAIIALLFARIFFKGMMKESEGTDTMKRIAGHVRKGAMAYLRQQYTREEKREAEKRESQRKK